MRLDIRVPVGCPIPAVVDFIARCEDAGVERVFLFPTHTVAGAYEMPEAEVEAVRRSSGRALAAEPLLPGPVRRRPPGERSAPGLDGG